MGVTADLLPNEKPEVGRLDTPRSSSHVRDGLLRDIQSHGEKIRISRSIHFNGPSQVPSGPRSSSPVIGSSGAQADRDEIVNNVRPVGNLACRTLDTRSDCSALVHGCMVCMSGTALGWHEYSPRLVGIA